MTEFIDNSKKVLKELNTFSFQEIPTFVLYGSYAAMELFAESPEILMKSDNFDYHIMKLALHEFGKDFLEEIVPIQTYVVIDENMFRKLHLNLCSKAGKIIRIPVK
ncbi:hypothetical protein [Maribacter sp. ACAM166]|uniref:hypothetical protein n=1 Tax=Maribacter sp. ACAM166 TaxID=2508996 RepID=UPI0010FF31FC|nr:hypothetical protein [Maribacter sp. ACAM166]TLP81840.1 hypothetical protein ES765_03940 [Maribacter sp. ACAM166]